MSKISELGPIKGANTRSEDLFVIVNLIQGDDGTKNITRRELVQALQYEIFDRITITGGNISGVRIFNSTLDNNVMENNEFNNGDINGSVILTSYFGGGIMVGTAVSNVEITNSDFSNGTGNNNVFTNTIVDFGALDNSTGNNNIFTNSTIDDSFYNNVTIEGGTANNLILTNITIDELILEDALISNSTIVTTDFSNGSISDSTVANVAITESDFSNGNIRDTDLDNVDITNSRFSNGQIWDTTISNSEIITTNIVDSTFSNGAIFDSTANNITITNSDFSDGTGNNNVFNNSTLENASLTGTMNNVVAQNIQISSSSSDGLSQNRSTITGSDIQESIIANSTIEDSTLVDFDMNLTKVFEPILDEDSYFALKNVKTGDTEKMTYRQLYDEVSRKTASALKVYVASDGDDRDDGTILKPVRTLKRAEELALEKAGGSYNRNDLNNAVHISVGPGTYYVDEPISLPDDCSMTSTAGQYATVIQKKPGFERTNGVLVGSGCYVQGFSYMNFEVDNFDQPEGGFAIAYRPGALMRRSPYLRDSTQLSNFNRLDIEPPLNPFNSKGTILDLGQEFYLEAGHSPQVQFEVDDEVTFSSGASGYISYVTDIDANRQIYVRNLKGVVNTGDMLYAQRGGTGTVESVGIDDFPNRLVGRGGGCLLADRAVLDTDSLFTYVLCFGFTPRTQNGTGYVAKNGAGVNGIGSLSIFTRQAFFALDGGQMTLNNSGSQFGDISMRARGSTVIIRPANANQLNLLSNTAFADSIAASKEEIIDDMIDYLTSNTSSGGLGYQGYNADKCFRDTGLIVDSTGYDLATNGNYWGRLNGITYRSPISYVVVNEQLTETVGSIEHLKDSIDYIFENTVEEVRDRVGVSLSETLNVLQNGEEFAAPIIFADTGISSATAARELVQDNREFIIEEFIDWLDNNEEFYAYDSVKCKRDVREFILPAVKYDALLNTNYNSVTAGNAYYFKAAKQVIGAQREETVAAYERLRKTTDEIVQPISSSFAVEAYEKFNEIISILNFEGDKFTPTDATYNTATGEFVITLGAHTLEIGRYVLLSQEAFTFVCNTDGNQLQLKHPRKTDPAYRSLLPIVATTPTTITLNVGSTGYSGVHTLIDVADDAVTVIGSKIEFSDDVAIDENRRNARKQLQSNREFIQNYMMTWANNEWFFYNSAKCQRDMKNYIVPAVLRDMQSGTNFNSIQSGIAYRSGIASVAVNEQLTETIGAINFLKQETANTVSDPIVIQRIDDGFNEIINIASANTGAGIYTGKFTPTNVDYNPVSGDMVITIGQHYLPVGKWISFADESITLSCANTVTSAVTQITHPRPTEPAYRQPVRITAVTANTITVNAANANGYTGVHTFVSALADSIDTNAIYWTDPAKIDSFYTPTSAAYNPTTGAMTVTLGEDHGFIAGDHIEFKPNSVVFSCANSGTGSTTQISHPRIGEPNYMMPLEILSVSNTAIVLNPGTSNGYTGTHTFVSAEEGAVVKMPSGVTRQGRNAAIKLQENRAFLQDELAAWTRDNYFIYREDLCARDTGLILDAVRRDMATGSNVNTVFAGLAYRSGNASATEVVTNQLVETVGAITWLKGQIQSITSGTGEARTNAAFDEIIDIMQNGVAAANPIVFGTAYVSADTLLAKTALQANRAFLQAEVTAWIAATHPALVYDVADCERDLGYFIDAISWDVQHGSNAATLKNARLYFDNAVGVLAEEEKPITAEAYKHIGNLAGMIVRQEAITPQSGSTQTFTTGFSPIAPAVAQEVINLFKAIGDIVLEDNFIETFIEAGYGTGIPQVKEPLLIGTGYDAAINTQYERISGATVKYQREIIDFIREEYNGLGYNKKATGSYGVPVGDYGALIVQAGGYLSEMSPSPGPRILSLVYTDLCYRDTGLIVDAITEDMEYGGDAAAANAASYYFKNAVSVLPYDQREPTRLAFEHLAGVIEKVVQGITVIPTTGNTTTQVVAGNVSNAPTGLRAKNLTNIISSTVDNRLVIPDYSGSLDADQKVPLPLPSATVALLPKIEPSRTFARKSLQKNKGFIQDEVVAFINDKYTDSLVYNQAKCRRDVGYMVDAISHDIQYGGNAAMWNAAQIYFVNMTNLLPLDQREPTKEAFARMAAVIYGVIYNLTVVKSPGNTAVQDFSNLSARMPIAAEARALGLMVADIADDNAPNNLPSRIEPENQNWMPAILITEKNKVDNALETLVKSMINFISTEYNGISYPKEQCRRDVGIIVDALSHDVQYATNYAIRLCANMYFDNATSVLPFDQRIQTADFYAEFAQIVSSIIVEGEVGQNTSNNPATITEANAAEALVGIIETAIRRDSLDAVPALVEPDTSWVSAPQMLAGEAIDAKLNELGDDVTDFLRDNFTIVDYSKAKCRRDSGYILDAMSWDLNYGGNIASRWNADFYFWNNILRIPENTRVATAQSYRYLGEIVSKVVTGSYPGQAIRPTLGSADQATQAYDLGLIFYNALFYNTPKALGPTINPNFAWEENKQFTFAKDILANNKTKLQREVQRFITSEYKFIDLPKTYRDAGNLLITIQNDIKDKSGRPGGYNLPGGVISEGSDRSTRAFVGALFNINAQHVFPVFNPPAAFVNWRNLRFKGTVETAAIRNALTKVKRWDSYIIPINNNDNRYIGEIWYWTGTTWASAGQNNTDLLQSFISSFDRIKDYINTNVATQVAQRTMITELIDNVLIDSVIRPDFLVFGSLVESIAHQFNGASAGVNRNALPLNFRNVGAAIGANASVLSENGGRIRWSGSDELNNQYFARGLKINGRTGRIEGRPFTSSVRKLARRASNSRASL